MVNKRGQQMTLGTIIAIVLGIAVLVFLIFGFSQGWNSLWDQVTSRSSSSNAELRIADCNNDCSNLERSSWCDEKKDLRFFAKSGKIIKVSGSCNNFSSGKVGKINVSKLGFKDCIAVKPC